MTNDDTSYLIPPAGTITIIGGPVGFPTTCTLSGSGDSSSCTFTYFASEADEEVWPIYASFVSSDTTHGDSNSLDSPQSLTIYTPTTTNFSCESDDLAYNGVDDSTECNLNVVNVDTAYDDAPPTGTITITGGPSHFPTTCALRGSTYASGCTFTYTVASGDEGVYSIYASFVSSDTTHAGSDSSASPQSLTVTGIAVSCGSVITANTTLSADIGPCSGNGLIIGANNIVLNCAGYSISGTGTNTTSTGISLVGISKVAVENCNVTRFEWGFVIEVSIKGSSLEGFIIESSSSITLAGNTANYNTGDGFEVDVSSNDTLTTNTASNNGREGTGVGIFLANLNYSTITGNIADNNTGVGFYVTYSIGNELTGNTANGNVDEGFYLSMSNYTTFAGNTANNNGNGFYFDVGNHYTSITGNIADNNEAYGYSDNAGEGIYGPPFNSYSGDECSGNYAGSDPSGLCSPQGDPAALPIGGSNNILTTNMANDNYGYGCFDDSTGSGTEGTVNFYTGDECSSAPSGLGSPQP